MKKIEDIISEELEKFDFLGNDKRLREQETNDLLMNPELQKQFICDALLGKNDRVKIKKIEDSYVSGDWEDGNDASYISLVYHLLMEYRYDVNKPPLEFNLYFDADKIDIDVDGWYDAGRWGGTMADAIEPSGEAWYSSFDWLDIKVGIANLDDDEIKFTAFEKAPVKIQELFIKHFVQNFIQYETLEFRTPDQKDRVQDTPYC